MGAEGAAEASEEAAALRAENELLRFEVDRLRAAVTAARPGTPLPPMTPRSESIAGGDAGRLVQLMRDGAQLLKEREELRARNMLLALDLSTLVEGLEGDDAVDAEDLAYLGRIAVLEAAMGRSQAGGFSDHPGGSTELPGSIFFDDSEELPDEDGVDLLLPLLTESDRLRAERVALLGEQQELAGLLQALDAVTEEQEHLLADVEALAPSPSPEQLPAAAQGAVAEDVLAREHSNLKAEIQQYREENERLRKDFADVTSRGALSPSRGAAGELEAEFPGLPGGEASAARGDLEFAGEFDAESQRRALAILLRSPLPREQPFLGRKISSAPNTSRAWAPSGGELDGPRKELALRGALHDLFRAFSQQQQH